MDVVSFEMPRVGRDAASCEGRGLAFESSPSAGIEDEENVKRRCISTAEKRLDDPLDAEDRLGEGGLCFCGVLSADAPNRSSTEGEVSVLRR